MDTEDVINNWSDIEEDSEDSDFSDCGENEDDGEDEIEETSDSRRDVWTEITGKI